MIRENILRDHFALTYAYILGSELRQDDGTGGR